jgi:hypothetical protein
VREKNTTEQTDICPFVVADRKKAFFINKKTGFVPTKKTVMKRYRVTKPE